MLREHITDPKILDLLHQYIHRCVHKNGEYKRIDSGIPIGCSLSPIMAALYLNKLDCAMEKLESKGIFYVRFNDDLVILSPNRYKFRDAIRTVNEIFAELALEKHPDKTFIGKLSHGFTFLGYHFQEFIGITGPSETSINLFTERISERKARYDSRGSIQKYVKRWFSYVCGGLNGALNFFLHPVDELLTTINIKLKGFYYDEAKYHASIADEKICAIFLNLFDDDTSAP